MPVKNKNNHLVVEEELGIHLDSEYAYFLDEHGDYDGEGIEVYGYSSEYNSINEIPCVIGATRLYKCSYKLSPHEIVISDSGHESLIIVLDNISGKVFELSTGRLVKNLISPSFNQWMKKEVKMSSADTVKLYLKDQQGHAYCDKCISDETGIKPPQQVNQITKAIEDVGDFKRADGICGRCKKTKKVTWIS